MASPGSQDISSAGIDQVTIGNTEEGVRVGCSTNKVGLFCGKAVCVNNGRLVAEGVADEHAELAIMASNAANS